MQNYRISMIRHGITEGNSMGRYIGITDEPLSAEGREQLEDLTALYDYPSVKKVYTSPLTRCVQTAQILFPDNRLQKIDDLREYNFGVFENRSINELSFDPYYQAWIKGSMEQAPNGGEPMDEFAKRITNGFCLIVEDMMKNGIFSAAVVGHSGVLSALMSRFCLPKLSPLEWNFESGKGYIISTSTLMWTRDNLAELVSHLPYSNEETAQSEYEWFDYSPSDNFSDT